MAKKRSTATRRAESQAASARAAAIRKEHERKERIRRSAVVGGVVVVVLALVLVIGYIVQSGRDTTGNSATAPTHATDTYALAIGPASAPAQVTVYEDFMCPICGELESASRSWLRSYTDQGKVSVHYVPISILDRASSGTQYSTRAASALGVVLDHAGATVAKKFHDLLYENQPEENSTGLTDDKLVDLAVQAGADRSAVSSPIKDVAYRQWVVNSTGKVSKMKGFQGTPFVLLNGKAFDQGGGSMSQLSTALKKRVDALQG